MSPSVLTHFQLHSALARTFLARRCLTRIVLAVAVHVNGFGSRFRCSIHSSIAALSSATSRKIPRLNLAAMPMKRLGQPDEIAVAIAFLLSDEMAYV